MGVLFRLSILPLGTRKMGAVALSLEAHPGSDECPCSTSIPRLVLQTLFPSLGIPELLLRLICPAYHPGGPTLLYNMFKKINASRPRIGQGVASIDPTLRDSS
jgi:hypothetical protein